MPVDPRHYDKRQASVHRVLLRNRALFGAKLVFLAKHNDRDGGWQVMAFDGSEDLSPANSPHALAEIEAGADYSEFPPFHNVEKHPGDWAVYLKMRNEALANEAAREQGHESR